MVEAGVGMDGFIEGCVRNSFSSIYFYLFIILKFNEIN